MEISLSLLSADQGNLRGEVEKVKDVIDSLHFDIMDGHFVPEIGLGMGVVEALRSHFSFPFYVHLMVEEPEKYIDRFAEAGADVIYIHIESTPHISRVLERIKDKGLKGGVALNPATPIIFLEQIWELMDVLLLLTVNPGYGGQKLLPFTIGKIKKAKNTIMEKGLPIKIAVDGGINLATVKEVCEAGASIIVVGSYVFESENPLKAIKSLRGKMER